MTRMGFSPRPQELRTLSTAMSGPTLMYCGTFGAGRLNCSSHQRANAHACVAALSAWSFVRAVRFLSARKLTPSGLGSSRSSPRRASSGHSSAFASFRAVSSFGITRPASYCVIRRRVTPAASARRCFVMPRRLRARERRRSLKCGTLRRTGSDRDVPSRGAVLPAKWQHRAFRFRDGREKDTLGPRVDLAGLVYPPWPRQLVADLARQSVAMEQQQPEFPFLQRRDSIGPPERLLLTW